MGSQAREEKIEPTVASIVVNYFKDLAGTIGTYPPEYKPQVHGPYDPARYYGKKDVPFGDVPLGDLMQWFGRRRKNPRYAAGAVSRAWWRWQHKYMLPKRAGIAGYFQLLGGFIIIFYYLNFNKTKTHRLAKYH